MAEQQPAGQFKPNVYPIMYWALVYGVLAGVVLFIVFLLSRYITIIWFPVFLVGLLLGAFRNYRKQKSAWQTGQGVAPRSMSFTDEVREAVSDIADASQEAFAEEQARTAAEAEQPPEVFEDTQNQGPQPPAPPTPPAA